MAKCTPDNTLQADVAAIDMPMVFNRLGAQNVNWQAYVLWHDLVHHAKSDDLAFMPRPLDAIESFLRPTPALSKAPFESLLGKVTIRPDLRPRPLVLRVAAGDCLRVRFVNLLTPVSNPFNATQAVPSPDHPMNHREHDARENINDQVASRVAGFHPQGLEWVRGPQDDSSFVGNNANSMPAPGQMREYLFHAPHEGAFQVANPGAVFGGEGTAGTAGTGLFGAVAVEPKGARFYRGQLVEEELHAAQRSGGTATTPQGQPVIDYEARYPDDCPSGPWCLSHKVGRPILAMVDGKKIVHGDINAVIVGPNKDGSFPPTTYPLESTGARNPTLPNRLEPFREFVSVFHDEAAVAQAFPLLFDHSSDTVEDNPLAHMLHGVRDDFMINYGSSGIGAEVLANRIGVGPMHDCVDCAFEEFFLSSFAVGDPALLVDKPANMRLVDVEPVEVGGTPDARMAKAGIGPGSLPAGARLGPKAKHAFYPYDPANVHHSYLGDAVKFRNVHIGKEQHIFHLHNHQWLFNPNDDNANYIDAQAIGPGSGYTYEIAFGGAGNRNRSAGDAIFHCHFYPHFAQGMWYLWRIHDTFEAGTRLAVSDRAERKPYDLRDGTPAKGARALPDGEIVAGTPIPAVVPLPGKALAPMPGKVEVVANSRVSRHNGLPVGSLAKVEKVPDATKPEIAWKPKANPGYPFWIAGIEHTMGSRPPTPPLDMEASAGGSNGGLPRHAVAGYSAKSESKDTFHRLSASKHEEKVMPVYFPEEGTGVEQFAMDWHARREHITSAVLPDGSVHATVFRTNGAPRTPGAPFFDPCIDDRQNPLSKATQGLFHNGALDARDMIQRQQPGDPTGAAFFSQLGGSAFDASTPRQYRGANIQLDVKFNKLGDHFGQQRILALWQDVGELLNQRKPPEPLVLRMNTFDCAVYLHTNLVPKEYGVDDYQITTPTDVIGQHIHLPKWDLPSADGSANGWNYEDGTFSPGMVRNRIKAINAWNAAAPGLGLSPVPRPDGSTAPLAPQTHAYFNGTNFTAVNFPPKALQVPDAECRASWQTHHDAHTLETWERDLGVPGKCDWLGARTTLQRWFSDPVINAQQRHRGLGVTFTHDHLGPSTHQQVGLYATMLSEPPNAVWRHNETGTELGQSLTRIDGGPTSWQSVITGCKAHVDGDPRKACLEYGPLAIDKHLGGSFASAEDSHREFFLQYGDFQHAYRKGEHHGVDADGKPQLPNNQSFRVAVNPSVRKPANPNFPDIVEFEPKCPGSKGPLGSMPRPCPEVISADDIGMMVVNYRNEPVAARVYDPSRTASDGKKGTQAAFGKGDLAYAFQSRTDRRISVLNGVGGEDPSVAGSAPNYPQDVNAQRQRGDPFTPMVRAYSGDLVRIKIQAGSHEHEHNGTIHGLRWLQGGSGYGASPTSGWRNSQNAGLSEQFTFTASIVDYEPSNHKHLTDRLWAIDTSQDGLWNGTWGVIRTYSRRDLSTDPTPTVEPLVTLPQNPLPTLLSTRAFDPNKGYTNDCGVGDGNARVVRTYSVLAVLANKVLGNPLSAFIPAAPGLDTFGGTLTYNHRSTEISLQIRDDTDTVIRTDRYGLGPLHDPTAIMLVREEDYDHVEGKLKPGVPVEPIVLRAGAGECVHLLLKNLLPRERWFTPMPDLNGYTSLSHTVTRDAGNATSSMTSFNNNLIRPSHHIGLHPQLLHYDASVFDGSVVGLNILNLVPPGGTHLYQWYAGDLHIPASQIQACQIAPAAAAAATLADVNALRQRVVGGLLRRSSTDLNTPFALGTRLLALLDPPSGDDVPRFENVQPGPPLKPGVIDRPPVRRPLDTTEPRLNTAPLVIPLQPERPGTARPPAVVLPRATRSLVPDESLRRAIAALLAQSAQRGCLEQPDDPVFERTRDTSNADERDAFLRAFDQQPGDTRFVVDSAPLLALEQAFNRLSATTLAAAGKPTRREACVQSMSEVARQVLLADQNLGPNYPRERLIAVADQWSKSFAFLVPGLDRDAFIPQEGSAAFRWWRPDYRPLDERTTRVATINPRACRFEPIEYGGSNLTAPDRIKQGQKGAVGGMVVLPPRSIWSERLDDQVFDHQDGVGTRASRATATVLYDRVSGNGLDRIGGFRDFVVMHQKGQNLRYGKVLAQGDPMGAVPVLAAERAGDDQKTERVAPEDAHDQEIERVAPEDAHDSGHMAINYGTEPMWFRFGMPNDAFFGHGGKPSKPIGRGLGGTQFAWQAFSSAGCCDSNLNQPSTTATKPTGEPATPVFSMLYAGGQSRLRMLLPTGVGRGTVTHLHGHAWRRDPYLPGTSSGVPAQCIGANPKAMWLSGQESITPMAHFDLVFDRTGGEADVQGDFLFRDQGGFGITNGLWGIVRNMQAEPVGFIDPFLGRPLKGECP